MTLRRKAWCMLGLVALSSCGVAGAALAAGLPSGAASGLLPTVSVSTGLSTATVTASVPVQTVSVPMETVSVPVQTVSVPVKAVSVPAVPVKTVGVPLNNVRVPALPVKTVSVAAAPMRTAKLVSAVASGARAVRVSSVALVAPVQTVAAAGVSPRGPAGLGSHTSAAAAGPAGSVHIVSATGKWWRSVGSGFTPIFRRVSQSIGGPSSDASPAMGPARVGSAARSAPSSSTGYQSAAVVGGFAALAALLALGLAGVARSSTGVAAVVDGMRFSFPRFRVLPCPGVGTATRAQLSSTAVAPAATALTARAPFLQPSLGGLGRLFVPRLGGVKANPWEILKAVVLAMLAGANVLLLAARWRIGRVVRQGTDTDTS